MSCMSRYEGKEKDAPVVERLEYDEVLLFGKSEDTARLGGRVCRWLF